jgi:hypothetical protein
VAGAARALAGAVHDRPAARGGWQPVAAYDVLVANLDPTLDRTPAPSTPEPLLEFSPDGLTTAEVALPSRETFSRMFEASRSISCEAPADEAKARVAEPTRTRAST